MPVLPSRSLLEKQLTSPVKNKQVDSPVSQVIPMHFSPGRLPDNIVIFVHDLEPLGTFADDRVSGASARQIRKRDPLLQRQLLGARPGIETNRFGSVFPLSDLFLQQIAQLLASLRKSGAHDSEKSF